MVQLRRRLLSRGFTLCLCLLLSPWLGGCVDYDLGIQFESQTHGSFSQTLHLSESLVTLSRETTDAGAEPIFQAFSQRAKALSGKVRRLDDTTMQVTLPFYSGAQLVERFNAFYLSDRTNRTNRESLEGTVSAAAFAADESDIFSALPTVKAHLDLQQRNFGFALRDRLTYRLEIDPNQLPMQALGTSLNNAKRETNWLTLDFHLQTPWGLTSTQASTTAPVIEGRTATWHLQAAQSEQIEATFWVPSPIGIGAGAIALICTLGYLIKYKLKAQS